MNSYPIHKAVFDECFEEGQFKTLRLQWKKFGDSPLFRINHHKDISIIAPLFYVTKTDVDLDLDRGIWSSQYASFWQYLHLMKSIASMFWSCH